MCNVQLRRMEPGIHLWQPKEPQPYSDGAPPWGPCPQEWAVEAPRNFRASKGEPDFVNEIAFAGCPWRGWQGPREPPPLRGAQRPAREARSGC